MLMPNLPGKATTQRVRIWRRLQAVGAVAVRPSVYVLPARDECLETFQWIAREIAELGGQTSLCEGRFLDGVTDDEIQRKFVEARTADYAGLAAESRALSKTLQRKRLSGAELAKLDTELTKAKRRFEEIKAVDFYDAPGREGVEGLLAGIERTQLARRGPKTGPSKLEPATRPHGATWVTRTGVHVDRIACAWLIRRFIDPAAKLKFVAPKGYEPLAGELRFDMFEAEFTHVGDRCSFEVLLERMRIEDPALVPIAEIVHELDVRDGKFSRAEAAGVHAQIAGVCIAHREDLARIAAAVPLFESLHTFFATRSRSTKKGSKT
jgi:hypothetical protein